MTVRREIRSEIGAGATARLAVSMGAEVVLDDLSMSEDASRMLVLHAIEVGCPVLEGGVAGPGAMLFSTEGGIPAVIFSEAVARPPNVGGDLRCPEGSMVVVTLENPTASPVVVRVALVGRT